MDEKRLILVTGGAGFFGLHIVQYLVDKGFSVRVYDLVDPDHSDYPEGVEFIKGDVRKREEVRRAMSGAFAVIHAAAALPLSSDKEIFTTNLTGTKIVLEEASLAKMERVVFISSTAVYGVPEHHPLTENDPVFGVGPYGESKIQAEKICAEYRHKGFCVPVLRPKTFIGTGRLGIFQILYDWVYSGKRIPIIGNG